MNLELLSELTTRRSLLRKASIFAAALAAGRAFAEPAQKAFTFFAINDLHYLSDDCGRWFRAMIEQMRASAPDAKLCLMSGDVTDLGTQEATASVKEIFGTLGVPFHPVPGNHDYTPAQSRAGYDAIFPDKLNYRVDHDGWQFIGLDTTMGTKADKTTIAETTLAWLDAELPKLDPQKPTVVFTHFPLGETVAMRPLNAEALLERLVKLNLAAVFSGHWHGASERKVARATLTTNRCSARIRGNMDKYPKKGWLVCEAKIDGTVTRRFVDFVAPTDIPTPDNAAKKSAPIEAPSASVK